MLLKIHNYLLFKSNYYSLIFIFLAAILIIIALYSLLINGADIQLDNSLINNITDYKTKAFAVLILSPLLETLIFYTLIIKVVRAIKNSFMKKLNGRSVFKVSLIIAAVLFGLSHSFSWVYVVYAFLIGVSFSIQYWYAYYRRKDAFIIISITHSLINLIVFTILIYWL